MLQQFNPKNKDLQVYVDGQIAHRDKIGISVFDSVVQGGDAVWEGLRLYSFGIMKLHEHLRRLEDSAHAMLFDDIPSRESIIEALADTLRANNMTDGVHIRLTLTRGKKITSGMDPRLNQSGSTLIILPEYKAPVYDNSKGISVVTSAIRRNAPMYVDSKIHHTNLINNILAKIQANKAGADAALMLDNYGFLAELNGTNIFVVRDEVLYTPFADACLHGITRQHVMNLAEDLGMTVKEKNISLTELYSADEVITTGTMGELTPVYEADGRAIVNKQNSQFLKRLNARFTQTLEQYCTPIL